MKTETPTEAFTWRSESGEPPPSKLTAVDDRLKADVALRRVSRGEHLLYRGDFQNARQLLGAMARRLPKPKWQAAPLEAFRSERRARQHEHQTLGRVVVRLDRDYRLELARAPDVREACEWAWGAAEGPTVVSLKQLLGMMGAAQWRRTGLEVPGLRGLLHPHYGVYLPTRADYVQLLLPATEVRGKRVFDVGAGTGVLGFILLQQGARSVVATDVDPRAVACARENAERLGLGGSFEALEADLFPPGRADWIVCNPPWIPEEPKNRVDRAVFDPGSAFLLRFLEGLAGHLEPGGQGLLILSDLAVRLGLREAGWLEEQFARAGLRVAWSRQTTPSHPKSQDRSDPLYLARAQELVTLYALVPSSAG